MSSRKLSLHSGETSRIKTDHDLRGEVIRKRLGDFARLRKGSDTRLFRELCFCLLTPQSKALSCDRALKELLRTRLLYEGRAAEIARVLRRAVRFHNTKAAYIVGARALLTGRRRVSLSRMLSNMEAYDAREWLVKHVKGLGYKEASHFLRNVGWGGSLAIIDRHIIRNFVRLGALRQTPASLGNRKAYLRVERRLQEASREIGIPLGELDLLFWSRETGVVFK